jgi:hypothetical protein
MKPFTYILKGNGKHCTATIFRPNGSGIDINTMTSQRNDAKSRAKKWAEKRVAFYNANFPDLTEE